MPMIPERPQSEMTADYLDGWCIGYTSRGIDGLLPLTSEGEVRVLKVDPS